MQIKTSRQPQFQKITDHSFQQLKKQCTLYKITPPPNIHESKRQKKTYEYLQVNYLKNTLYKVSPALHSKVPLHKQEQNLRDYLIEVQHDVQKHEEIRNQLKSKYFLRNQPSKNGKSSSHSTYSKRVSHSLNDKKYKHQSIIELFDPIEYLQQKQSQKKKLLSKKIKKLQGLHMFAQNIDSVKYISEAPDIKIPEPLPTLVNKSLLSFTDKTGHKLQNTHHEISKSISQIMEKSMKYQSLSKNGPKKLKHYKSRNDLKKSNDKKIQTQRKKIMSMIHRQSSVPTQTNQRPPITLNQIPAKQKYAIDFTSYLRTKTKDQLDKYIYQKLVKKPQKDLEKFHEFMLKEVKFQNQENKHKMERFFIKMRSEFKRVQKYSQQRSKFDWRSKSMHLDEMKKEDQQLGVSKIFEEKVRITEGMNKSVPKKFKSARERFLKVESVQRNKAKHGPLQGLKINELQQSIAFVEGEQQGMILQ